MGLHAHLNAETCYTLQVISNSHRVELTVRGPEAHFRAARGDAGQPIPAYRPMDVCQSERVPQQQNDKTAPEYPAQGRCPRCVAQDRLTSIRFDRGPALRHPTSPPIERLCRREPTKKRPLRRPERVCDLASSLPLREGELLAEVRFCRLELANAVARASAAPPLAEVGGVTYTSSEA